VHKSYSQEGEDLIVERLLGGKRGGIYVDVGCHHPFRFSNTYLFYSKGWNGVCIDPLPGTKRLFYKCRPRDIVIEAGVSKIAGLMKYFMFNEPALNTFDENVANQRGELRNYKIEQVLDVATDRLDSLLKAAQINGPIDFMSIDVEGFDLQVLETNDWNIYKPKIIIVEALGVATKFIDLMNDPVVRYLTDKQYILYVKTGNSLIFISDALGL
jgi:FkbM family methyltransferase